MEQKRKIPTLFYGGIVLCLVFIVNYLLVVLLDFRYERKKRRTKESKNSKYFEEYL